MSDLNAMVRGALPSSVSESAHASSGEPTSSSSSVLAPAAVVGGEAGAVAAGATVVGYCARNEPRSLLGAGATMVFDDMARLASLLRD